VRREENRTGDELLLQLFCGGRQYWHGAAHIRDHHHAFVGAAGAVLKFLSYVEPDDGSAFGFRPTPGFITVLLTAVECGRDDSRKCEPTASDNAVIQKLIQVSGAPEFWGFDGVHGQGKLSSLLVRLGLADWNQYQDKVIPMDALFLDYPHLHELAVDGF
jgi:hypothetical protein